MPTSKPPTTQRIKLVGIDVKKVPVRTLLSFKTVKYINSGDIIEVNLTSMRDFYSLADESVRLTCY